MSAANPGYVIGNHVEPAQRPTALDKKSGVTRVIRSNPERIRPVPGHERDRIPRVLYRRAAGRFAGWFWITHFGVNPWIETVSLATLSTERSSKVGKRRNFPEEFKWQVVARMKESDNIQALAVELDLDRRMMYRWREQFARDSKGEWRPPQQAWDSRLRRDLTQLKRVLADQTIELDFFKGALQKVEARRQQRGVTGAKASTTKSGK